MMSVLAMMNGQIIRLEHYTQKMNTVQKLEDIAPDMREFQAEKLFSQLAETGNLICGEKFHGNYFSESKMIFVDAELVMQVYENLISNAVRYAEQSVSVDVSVDGNLLKIAVCDDGSGFQRRR